MKDNDELRCIGCGAVLQSDDPKQAGYVPASTLAKYGEDETRDIYCQRCFRLRHYNEISPVSLTDDDFRRLLSQIRDDNALVVYVTDVFDFNGSLIPGLSRFVGNNPILLVANKADLLPSSLRESKLVDWIRQQANQAGLRPIDVDLVSAKTNQSVDALLAKIDKLRQGRDVYVVGVTNVGKSTLINQIIRQSSGIKDLITTSRFPGTTLDQIKIPLADGKSIIDTPGIIHSEQMAHYLTGKDLKLVSPQKPIKPKSYQLNPEQTLFLGGIGRFDYLQGNGKKGFIVYVENNLLIHRTKLENADAFYEKHLGDLLTPPTEKTMANFPPLVRYQFKTHFKADLVIEGLGWVSVPANVIIAGWAPKGVSVLLRRAMI